MCLARAYLDDEKRPLLEEVAELRVEGNKLRFRTLFGEERELQACLREIDFQNSTILLERLTEG